MSSFRFFLFMVLLAVTSTQGFLTKKINAEENASATGETYLQGIKTIAQNVKDAISLKKNTVVNAVSAVGNAKHGIIRDIKDNKKKLIESVLATQLAKVNAIKAAKEEYVKTIMAHEQPFFIFQNKLQKFKEAIPTLPSVEGLQSRFLHLFLEFYDKFQGHFKKHKKFHNGDKETLFAFIPHQITNGLFQVQGNTVNAEADKPEINFFPSEAAFPVAQTAGTPSEYVQPIQEQPEFEPVRTEGLLSGHQPNQYSPPAGYDEPTQDDFAPPEFSAVDLTDHQSIPYIPSPYYGPPPASGKSPSVTYDDTSN